MDNKSSAEREEHAPRRWWK